MMGAGVSAVEAVLLSYLAILSAAIAGFAGLPPWTIAAAAIALSSLSYAEHVRLYKRSQDLGFAWAADRTLVRSILNAVVAATVAYGGGWVLRLV